VRSRILDSLDWAYLARLAELNGMRPIFYRGLCIIVPPHDVPEALLSPLRTFAFDNATRNLWLAAEVLNICDGLKKQGIAAIPFKGPTLSSWAYGELGLRESSDLDLIVRQANLVETITFLRSQGYRPRNEPATQSQSKLLRYHAFNKPDSGISLDLQLSLEGPHFSFALDRNELWNRAEPRNFAGGTVLSFSAEDHLMLLCVHGVKDLWVQVKWVCDIAGLINNGPEIDFHLMLDRAKRLRSQRMLLLGLLLAHRFFGARLPEAVLDLALRNSAVVASADGVVRRFVRGNQSTPDSYRVGTYLKMDDTFLERMKRCNRYLKGYLRLMLPSEDDRKYLQARGWPRAAGYLVRLLRLMVRYAVAPQRAVAKLKEHLGSMQ